MKTTERVLAGFGLLVEDARACVSNFIELSYSHVKRDGNKVAHCLAKLEVKIFYYAVRMEDVPPSVFLFVQANQASFSD